MNKLAAGVLLAALSVLPLHAENDINKLQIEYEQIVARDPRNADALFTLALIYEKKGMRQDALGAWRRYRALETDPVKRGIAQKHIHLLSQ